MRLPRLYPSPATRPGSGESRLVFDLALLTLLVVVTYFARIDHLPPLGEESRRALGAMSMIESGDWVVPRIGGVVFPDRPPMTNWLIAAASLIRGETDVVAIRLPSIIAVLATTLLLYVSGSLVDSRLTAAATAAAYATFAQVMQLGRLGESEAVFAFFSGGALLLWHLGFVRGWRPAWAWLLGYTFVALGALVKGIQAPLYFGAATGVFLLLHRRWSWLFGWGHWLGLTWFGFLVALWQVPYYRAAGLQASLDTWLALITARIAPAGLMEHVLSYPLETLGCVAPWSLLLFTLAHRDIRRGLSGGHPQVAFALTALAVTYPTVWFAAGAESRYFFSLYPCLAILIGALVAHLAGAETESQAARAWRLALRAASAFAWLSIGALGVALAIPKEWAIELRPSGLWAVLLLLAAAAALTATRWARARPGERSALAAVLAAAALFGTVYTTFWVNSRASRRQDVRPPVSDLSAKVPETEDLVSLGPVDARFAYPYGKLIREVPWPETLAEIPRDLSYFCFDVRPTDTAESRYAERGMQDQWTTPGTLPFEWVEIGRVGVGAPKNETPPSVAVVIGRVVRTDDGRPVPAKL